MFLSKPFGTTLTLYASSLSFLPVVPATSPFFIQSVQPFSATCTLYNTSNLLFASSESEILIASERRLRSVLPLKVPLYTFFPQPTSSIWVLYCISQYAVSFNFSLIASILRFSPVVPEISSSFTNCCQPISSK